MSRKIEIHFRVFVCYVTSIPERSKGADLSSVADASWVQIPPLVLGSTETQSHLV